jgi:prepilin-type N-terminal cleavage/methylation domain-containing protein
MLIKQSVGFNLIEMLVGLAVGSAVLAAGLQLYSTFISGVGRDKMLLNARTDLAYLFDNLSVDLQNTGKLVDPSNRTKGSIKIAGAQTSGDRQCIILNWTEKSGDTVVEKFKAYRFNISGSSKGSIEVNDSLSSSDFRPDNGVKIKYPDVCPNTGWRGLTPSNLNVKAFKLCRLNTASYDSATDSYSAHAASRDVYSQALTDIDDKTKSCVFDRSAGNAHKISTESYIEYPEKYLTLYLTGELDVGIGGSTIPVSRTKVVGLYYSPILRF